MEKKLIISKISLEQTEEKNIRICTNIKSDKEDYKLWFEIEKEYKDYILIERADAFLVAILPYAIKKELDIIIEDKISSKLFYQLSTYLIPMFCNFYKKRIIKIDSNLDNCNYNVANAVGTAISCGIDSLYTIQKHINLKENEFNLTHLTFFNAGASGQFGGKEARDLYIKQKEISKNFASQNNFKFVSVDSNMNEFLMMSHLYTHTFRNISCVLVLQKLFSKYYFSSTGYDFNDTKLDEEAAYADILILKCLETEDITFYSAGIETNRMGKVKEVVKYEPSYNSLSVCPSNCGKCSKCKRTILALDAIDKIDLYKNVFNIDYFYKHKISYFSWLLKSKRRKEHYTLDIYNEYKIRHKRIPILSRIISYLPDKKTIKNKVFWIFGEKRVRKWLGQEDIINDGWTDLER